MDYKLIITERAEELLDEMVYYLTFRIKNRQAAAHLLEGIEKIYIRLEVNPYQFPECTDRYLKRKGFREAVVTDMNYLIVFKVEQQEIIIMGIFHQLECYNNKL